MLAATHHRLRQTPAPRVLRFHGGAAGRRNGNGPLRVPTTRLGWCPSLRLVASCFHLTSLFLFPSCPGPYSTANTSSCTSARRTPRTAIRCWRPWTSARSTTSSPRRKVASRSSMSVGPRTPSSSSNFGYDAGRMRMGRVVLEPRARCRLGTPPAERDHPGQLHKHLSPIPIDVGM